MMDPVTVVLATTAAHSVAKVADAYAQVLLMRGRRLNAERRRPATRPRRSGGNA
jgi:hypothetical protein